MKYSKIKKYDANNWTGINTSIFFSGCTHHCEDCFNSDIWDFDVGKDFTFDTIDIIIKYASDEHVSGVCILGGEPFQQDLFILLVLVERLNREVGKPIHIWTGYRFEELLSLPNNIVIYSILSKIDTLVDGRFMVDKKDLSLKFRGSSNQRVIDVKQTLKENKIILIDETK